MGDLTLGDLWQAQQKASLQRFQSDIALNSLDSSYVNDKADLLLR